MIAARYVFIAFIFVSVIGAFIWQFTVPFFAGIQKWCSDPWMEVPCTVLTAERRGGGRGSHYALVTYRYDFEGRQYTNDLVFLGFKKGYVLKKDEYVAGRRSVCFVNPKWPDAAVLRVVEPPVMLRFLFYALLPVGIGGTAILGVLINVIGLFHRREPESSWPVEEPGALVPRDALVTRVS